MAAPLIRAFVASTRRQSSSVSFAALTEGGCVVWNVALSGHMFTFHTEHKKNIIINKLGLIYESSTVNNISRCLCTINLIVSLTLLTCLNVRCISFIFMLYGLTKIHKHSE